MIEEFGYTRLQSPRLEKGGEVMELREQIAGYIGNADYTLSAKTCMEVADQILALGLVEIDPDAELPQGNIFSIPTGEWWAGYGCGYIEAQQDMVAQGWRKVVK